MYDKPLKLPDFFVNVVSTYIKLCIVLLSPLGYKLSVKGVAEA